VKRVAGNSSALLLAMLVATSCAAPSSAPSASAVVQPATPAASATSTATLTPSPSPAFPTPSLTVAPTVNTAPASFVLTVNVTSSSSGQPLRTAVNIHRARSSLCGELSPAVFGDAGSTTVIGQATFRLSRGTYVIQVSPREAPFGNWWWNGKTTCESADQLNLASDTVANFTIPPR